MSYLPDAGPAELAAISAAAATTCVVFRAHRLPAGCRPSQGDVAFEGQDDGVRLLLQRGVTYTGRDARVASWARTGSADFADVTAAVAWLGAAVASSTPRPVTDLGAVTPARRSVEADDITAALLGKVVGQDAAIRSLVDLVTVHVAKPQPRRPATALLVGPTGVGKTYATELLAAELEQRTSSTWGHVRMDMNELSEKHTVARLFGSAPGYIGYGDGRDLATSLRARPTSLVVFDEIDKAHRSVWHALMNLMDAGRLGTGVGDTDVRKSILLFTSNRHADVIAQNVSPGDPSGSRVRPLLRQLGYPPEIVGRIGRVIPFHQFSGKDEGRLVLLAVQRVVATFGLELEWLDPATITDLLARTAGAENGVRDIEHHLEAELGCDLREAVRAGATRVRIDDVPPSVSRS